MPIRNAGRLVLAMSVLFPMPSLASPLTLDYLVLDFDQGGYLVEMGGVWSCLEGLVPHEPPTSWEVIGEELLIDVVSYPVLCFSVLIPWEATVRVNPPASVRRIRVYDTFAGARTELGGLTTFLGPLPWQFRNGFE